MYIYTMTDSNLSLFAKCTECGSICYGPSQFQVNLTEGTYLMAIDQRHEFEMLCSSKVTANPTADPIAIFPSSLPTVTPSANPTTANPTANQALVIVIFDGIGTPTASTTFLTDPYGRFEAACTVSVGDDSLILDDLSECDSCFVWQYKSDGESEWTAFDVEGNDGISMSITKSGNEYTSKLVVQSVRRQRAGYCVDDEGAANHPFAEDTVYQIRLKFDSDPYDYFVAEMSNSLDITTNALPSGGLCIIQNADRLDPLDRFNFFCVEWDDDDDLEYNALIGDVVMDTDGFVDDAREIIGFAPSGNVTVTVLVKERGAYNAITCYAINATFKTMSEFVREQGNGSNTTSTHIVDGVLGEISNFTNNTSLSAKPDLAVSIQLVLEDLVRSNLTTESEAAQIVDDVVSNVLSSSAVLSPNASTLTAAAIVTELACISAVTAYADIVDSASTTSDLVDSYLGAMFDAVDLYLESTDNAATAVQDALYSVGEQSQRLISNLEATLTVDDISNLTDDEIDSINSLSESLVDYATLSASTALAQSDVGETFSFESYEYGDDGSVSSYYMVSCLKFEADNSSSAPVIGFRSRSIELPSSFLTKQDGIFDCAMVASSTNNFIPKRGRNEGRNQRSEGILTANVYGDTSRRRRRRRRLTETVEHNATECIPYFITMSLTNASSFNLSMTLENSSDFPSCDFWNTGDSYWSGAGCFVYDITNDSVICGCTHLTTFSCSADEVWPETVLFFLKCLK